MNGDQVDALVNQLENGNERERLAAAKEVLEATGLQTVQPQQCCCHAGAALTYKGSGEIPEFMCAGCPFHSEDSDGYMCKRHKREATDVEEP